MARIFYDGTNKLDRLGFFSLYYNSSNFKGISLMQFFQRLFFGIKFLKVLINHFFLVGGFLFLIFLWFPFLKIKCYNNFININLFPILF